MAETERVSFELVSPEHLVVAEDAEMVVVPGSQGNIGVLARHAPLIASLRPGVVEVCHRGREADARYFVASGFVEVTGERCTVLAEHPEPVGEIDRGAAEKALERARVDCSDAKDERERADAAKRIAVNEAKLRAVAG